MPDSPPTPESYVIEHVRQVLAQDPRVGILDAEVTIVGSRIFVSGEAETAARRDAVSIVLSELLPDHQVTNEMVVEEPGGRSGSPEALA